MYPELTISKGTAVCTPSRRRPFCEKVLGSACRRSSRRLARRWHGPVLRGGTNERSSVVGLRLRDSPPRSDPARRSRGFFARQVQSNHWLETARGRGDDGVNLRRWWWLPPWVLRPTRSDLHDSGLASAPAWAWSPRRRACCCPCPSAECGSASQHRAVP